MRVNLIANTSQFKSAMAESSSQIKLMNSEFKNASAETDKYGNKLDATSAKKKQLNGVIQQYTARIKTIKEEQKHWTRELEKGNITEEEHAQKQKELARRLNNTEAEMKRYEGQLKKINAEGKNTKKTYAEFDKQFRDVGKTMRDVGVKVGIAAGVGFMALKRVLTDVVREAKDFHAQMSEVQAISGATAEEMKVLTDQSKDLGKQTKFTAQEAAESQAGLARAGFKTNEIVGAMPGLLDLAASSNLELANASKITSNIIRTFNYDAKEAGRVADVLAKGAATANTDVEGLGQAMQVAGPVANSLDISLEQVAASAGLMADAGISGSKSGRMLRQGMLRLAKPTGKAAGLLEEMAINAFDSDGNMKSLDKVVGELEKGLKGQTKQQKAAALATIFGSESTAGWTVLLDKGSKELKDYTKELENSEGAAKKMGDIMMDNAEGAIVRMQSALSGLKIELGEKLLPILSKGADFIGNLANKLSDMDEETIETIAKTALLVTAVLGVTTVVAGLVTGIGAFMMVAGPVGLAIAGGTLLLGGLAAALYNSSQKTKKLAEDQEKAKTEAIRYGEGLSEGTQKGVQGYTDLYEGAKLKMYELKNMSGDEAKATVEEIRKAFAEMQTKVVAELEQQRDELTRVIREIYTVAGEHGKEAADKLNKDIIANFEKDIKEYDKAFTTIDDIAKKHGDTISEYPDEVRKNYEKAMEIIEQGSAEFARTQKEIGAIQQSISEKQGKILYDEAQKYGERINDNYKESVIATNEYFSERSGILEQGLSHDRISQEEYDNAMTGLQAQTDKMLHKSVDERDKAMNLLAEHTDTRGKLLDIATGQEFERAKVWEQSSERYGAGMSSRMETDEEYMDSYLKHTKETLLAQTDFGKKTQDQYINEITKFVESMGYSKSEATRITKELVDEALGELEKGDGKAKKAGTDKGKSHFEGIESTNIANEIAASNLSRNVSRTLGKTTDGGGGKKAGSIFGDGVLSQRYLVSRNSQTVAKSGVSGLRSVRTYSAGTDFVSGFSGSIRDGKGSVGGAAWGLAKHALSSLKNSIQSKSPSKLTGKLGIDFADGFTNAIDDGKKGSIKSAKVFATDTMSAMSGELDNHKNTFNALAFALEDNKHELKIKHVMDEKFEQFMNMFNLSKKDNDTSTKELLSATLQQNNLLMQLLQKDNTAVIGFEEVYNPVKKRLNQDRYSGKKRRR